MNSEISVRFPEIGARSYRSNILLRFEDDHDEMLYINNQLSSRTLVFHIMFTVTMVLEVLYTLEMIVTKGVADKAPLVGSVLIVAFWRFRKRLDGQERLWFRRVAVWMYTVYINIRLSLGVLIMSADYAPPVVKEGFVAPYALVAPGCIMMAGVNCGLRPMRDVALLSCITQITSVLHIAAVLGPNGSNTKVNYIITGTFATMWGIVAGYFTECTLRRRWMYFPYNDEADAIRHGVYLPAILSSKTCSSLTKSILQVFDDEDEEAYLRGDVHMSKGFFQCLAAIIGVTNIGYFCCVSMLKKTDETKHKASNLVFAVYNVGILVFMNVFFKKAAESYKLRVVVFYFATLMANTRLVLGTGVFVAAGNVLSRLLPEPLAQVTIRIFSTTPPELQEGFPLPYGLLGVFFLNCLGTAMGLRTSRDCLPVTVLTAFTAIYHLKSTVKNSLAQFTYISLLFGFVILETIARYHAEYDQRRRWMQSRLLSRKASENAIDLELQLRLNPENPGTH